MANSAELLRTPEWAAYPHVQQLLDPNWKPSADRLLKEFPFNELLGSGGGLSDNFSLEVLKRLQARGLLLDVGCGLNSQEQSISTPVGKIPTAYGIDPILRFFPQHNFDGRTIAGYAEDMPFKDKTFKITLSLKCVGWYSGSTVQPYWAIREMVRVTDNGGLISIGIGSGGGVGVPQVSFEQNLENVKSNIDLLRGEEIGERIAEVVDFSAAPAPQINLVLA